MDESRDQRTLRASDADRERVADLLRQAASDGRLSLTELDERIEALYTAKTYAELEPVVHDLPGLPDLPGLRADAVQPAVRGPETGVAPVARDRVVDRVGGRPTRREGKAVFSGLVRRGEWVVPTDYRVKAVFGGAELDLRDAKLESNDVHIHVKAVFGGINIVVPDDIRADVEVDGVFGGCADPASERQPSGPAPVVRVSGKAVFGGVNVQRKSRTEA